MASQCPDEERLIAFLEGALSEQQCTHIEAHLDTCGDCRQLLGALLSQHTPREDQTPPTPKAPNPSPVQPPRLYPRGTACGKYTLLSPIGWGGMGVVYKAFDPELHRIVALKLLRPTRAESDPSPTELKRLQREAQAMAQLYHPHVITIFEAGIFQGAWFFAMPYVEGMTLRQWLQSQQRTHAEIIDAFQQAGRGLAAVHKAGFVHRDFKPDNVLVDRDGHVFVTDFGLVSTAGAALPETNDLAAATAWEQTLTTTGALVGTPAYMSPEYIEHNEASPRSDQFSFFLALYEALLQSRPFNAATLAQRQEAIKAGLPDAPPAGHRISPGLWRALRQGLSYHPKDRFGSMDACLDSLAHAPKRRLPGRGYGLLAAGLVALIAMMSLRPSAPTPCQRLSSELGALWSKRQQTHIQRAIQRAGSPTSQQQIWRKTRRHLSGFVSRLQHAQREICHTAQGKDPRSLRRFDLRAQCLRQKIDRLRALLTSMQNTKAHANEDQRPTTLAAVYALPAVHRCSQSQSLLLMQAMPPHRQTRKALHAIYRQLAMLQTRECRAPRQSLRLLRTIHAQAAVYGYNPLMSRIAWSRGLLYTCTKQWKEAADSFSRAAQLALAGKAYHIVISAWIAALQAQTILKRFQEATATATKLKQIFSSHPAYAKEWTLLRLRYQLSWHLSQQIMGQRRHKKKLKWPIKGVLRDSIERYLNVFAKEDDGLIITPELQAIETRCKRMLRQLLRHSALIIPNKAEALCQPELF